MVNIKKLHKNNKFKIPAPTWNKEFKLSEGLYSMSDIQDYFQYILKKHGEKTANLSTRIQINKRENRITFKTKTGYYLKLLTLEILKSHISTKSKITKDENGVNVPNLEITEVVLVHCNIVNNNYQEKINSIVYICS